MDVTPQLIEQIDFPEKFRGYDPDEVDDFLERCGATITDLTNRVNEYASRAERAEIEARNAREAAANASAGSGLSDEQEIEQATRTLVLAKRTADAVVSEARQEASRLVTEAQESAEAARSEVRAETDRLLGEARSTHETALKSAREDAEREFGVHRDRNKAEIRGLEERKAALQGDLAALEGRFEEYLAGLRSVIASVKAVVDDPGVLRSGAPLNLATGAADVVDTTASESPRQTGPLGGFAPEPPSPPPPRPTFTEDPESPAVASDPWGPGSWSTVSASPGSANDYDGPGFASAPIPATDPNDRFVRPEDHAGFQPADPSQDRYLRQLDEAVNGPDADLDRAMSSFFEGDEGPGTQFGR